MKPETIRKRITNTAKSLNQNDCQITSLSQFCKSLNDIFMDKKIYGHSKRVQFYMGTMYDQMLKSQAFLSEKDKDSFKGFIRERLMLSAGLHDIGKLETPDEILHKDSALSDEEFDIMKKHTDILDEVSEEVKADNGKDFLLGAREMAKYHHEKYKCTTKGYHGLSGEEIPLSARMVAIVDAYDAMVSERTYNKSDMLTHEEACKIIQKDAGTHFDPSLVIIFLMVNEQIKDIYEKNKDSYLMNNNKHASAYKPATRESLDLPLKV